MAHTFTLAEMAYMPKEVQTSVVRGMGGKDVIFLRSKILDFDNLATLTSQALATGDIYPTLGVKAGELILNAGVDVLTVATAAAQFDLGFTTDSADGLLSVKLANDASFTTKTAVGALLPLYMSANDNVDLLETSAAQSLAGCVARVWILVAKW
jgi:hypothetical protein